MTTLHDRDLCRVRLRLLDLFKSLFVEEPDAEKLGRWRGIFSALARAEVSPEFDREAGVIAGLLWSMGLKELQVEYRRVLGNPFAARPVILTASCLQPDRGEFLEGVREIMAEAGLIHAEEAKAAEDGLVVLLDILAALVEEEKAGDRWRARELQGRLLEDYLVPLAERLEEVLEEQGKAYFFRHCSSLLCGYLELELELAEVW